MQHGHAGHLQLLDDAVSFNVVFQVTRCDFKAECSDALCGNCFVWWMQDEELR